MLAGNVAGSNVSAYGQYIASGPDVGVWGGSLPAAAMAGANLCEDQGSGCVVELYDGFANVVPQPGGFRYVCVSVCVCACVLGERKERGVKPRTNPDNRTFRRRCTWPQLWWKSWWWASRVCRLRVRSTCW